MTHWRCPTGHISTVARFPNAYGVRRCYFCPEVVEAVELVADDEVAAMREAASSLRRACQDAGSPVVPTPVAEAIARVTAFGER